MQIKEVEFLKSSSEVEQCPNDKLPEYAFVGRSNVGKSSLINYLTNKRKIAKTSGKPGHTQLINHFLVDKSWYLVDLPGYGYAKKSKSVRKEFQKIITNYLSYRRNLVCLFLLIDSRHEPLNLDLDFIQWLGETQIPFVICFTKLDKLTKTERTVNIESYKNRLLESWEYLPEIFLSSVTEKIGREKILEFIERNNKLVNKQ